MKLSIDTVLKTITADNLLVSDLPKIKLMLESLGENPDEYKLITEINQMETIQPVYPYPFPVYPSPLLPAFPMQPHWEPFYYTTEFTTSIN